MTHRWLLALTVAGLLAAAPAIAHADGPPPRTITFSGRFKLDQKFIRTLKILGDTAGLPLSNETLTSLLNSPSVCGAAAADTFGITTDVYRSYIQLAATTNSGQLAVLAQVEMTFHADQRVDDANIDRFILSIRGHLAKALLDSVAPDREFLDQRFHNLESRRQDVEKMLKTTREQRIEMAERAGMAEFGREFYRNTIATLLDQKRQIDMDLAVKQAVTDSLRRQIAQQQSQASPADPLGAVLEKLVDQRAKQRDAITASAGHTPDAAAAAEAQFLEAKVQWIARVDEVQKTSPQGRLETLKDQVVETDAKQNFIANQLNDIRCSARDQFRYAEDVEALKDQEIRLNKRLEQLEEQVDQVLIQNQNLSTVNVAVLGLAIPPATATPAH